MVKRIRNFIKYSILCLDYKPSVEELKNAGLILGENVHIMGECDFDVLYPWLIEVGDNVTFAPGCMILAHDASTKNDMNYSKIGNVKIGNNVFVGAKTIILPGVTIGNSVIIGAGSVITKDVKNNSVVAGNPQREIMSYEEYLQKENIRMKNNPPFDKSYTVWGNVTTEKKEYMKKKLKTGKGYIV